MAARRVYWHQAQGGRWCQVTVWPGSLVAHKLANLGPGLIWQDDYGNAYRYEWVD